MEDIDRWSGHSRMSDPAGHADAISALPRDIGLLNQIIQGVLVHSEWLQVYGLDGARLHSASRATLAIPERLDDILQRDSRPLQIRRPPERRAIGTCRDFALMLCSFLRSKGVPSRVRCGFAAYFGDGWEDHWVCEYWDEQARAWRLSDAQMDPMMREMKRIEFDPADVPRQFFMTAGQAWADCRRANSNGDRFGHGDVTGLWFVKVNVWRDHHVLNGKETSAWDRWREAPSSKRVVYEQDIALLDNLAADPEQRLVEGEPDWLG
jgi:hypothetical protein